MAADPELGVERRRAPTAARGEVLLEIARRALRRAVERTPAPQDGEDDAPWLRAPGASFVTLHLGGALRGCIGSVHASRPLGEDVRSNARSAALQDSRFRPLTRGELDRVSIEVSLLSPLQPLEVSGEDELRRRLRPRIDGLYIEAGFHRALFLPQVWRSLPRPADFVARLKLKAGMAEDAWPEEIRCWTFTVESWSEEEPTSAE